MAGGRIATSSSVFVWTGNIDSRRHVDGKRIVFCRDRRLIDWLRREHPLCEILHPIAEGKLLLDAAGLPSEFRAANDVRDVHAAGSPGDDPDAVRMALRIVENDLGGVIALHVSASRAIPAPPPATRALGKPLSSLFGGNVR
ncbi:hypothetical protein [Burkholderia ubonensis]|uniref:hypothetical protein n=1 Tax=Burkholderia ubonensis TaxID=101571 RepID=UPI0012F795BE|nr:hypothetical protein [Burkholderia ubonensis]